MVCNELTQNAENRLRKMVKWFIVKLGDGMERHGLRGEASRGGWSRGWPGREAEHRMAAESEQVIRWLDELSEQAGGRESRAQENKTKKSQGAKTRGGLSYHWGDGTIWRGLRGNTGVDVLRQVIRQWRSGVPAPGAQEQEGVARQTGTTQKHRQSSVCFPLTEPGLCMNPWLFSAHTQTRQLADREEIFAEFDKKCKGLELQAAPF